MEIDEYPVMGEVPAVDLANTWYAGVGGTTDYVETPARALEWWGAMVHETAAPLPSVTVWSSAEHRRLVGLRNAVRDVLLAVADGTRVGQDALDTINVCTTRAPMPRLLAYAPDHRRPRLLGLPGDVADGPPGAMGVLADSCVGLFVGAGMPWVGRCEGPGCPLLFIRHHARRRHCHRSCAQRGRQARYYQRHRVAAARGAAGA